VITDSLIAELQAKVALQTVNRYQVDNVTEQTITRTEKVRTIDTAAAVVV
jgi:hypothetical protein